MSLANTYIQQNTNINIVVDNLRAAFGRTRYKGRRSGKTFNVLLHMASRYLVGPIEAKYLYIGPSQVLCKNVLMELVSILDFRSVDYLISDNSDMVVTPHNRQAFIFQPSTTTHDWQKRLRGISFNITYIDSVLPVSDLNMIASRSITIYHGQ